MESAIRFGATELRLEGRLHAGSAPAVVVTHPHSLYGGNMHNPVVETIVASYRHMGYTTLRFNFRGVEGSQGQFDEGRGEQEDVAQAVAYLQQVGCKPIALSGYSFGTWVNAHYATGHSVGIPMTMVAPPVAFMDFRDVQRLPGLALTVAGSRDDIAPPEMLKRLLPRWNPGTCLEVLPGADHFFFDHLAELQALLEANLPPLTTDAGR